mgnify:CR=1 FL=1
MVLQDVDIKELACKIREKETEIFLDGDESGKDELFQQCLDIISKEGKASTSLLQRKLQIGYNRAARIIEDMEKAGIVTPMQSNGNREIVAPNNND